MLNKYEDKKKGMKVRKSFTVTDDTSSYVCVCVCVCVGGGGTKFMCFPKKFGHDNKL